MPEEGSVALNPFLEDVEKNLKKRENSNDPPQRYQWFCDAEMVLSLVSWKWFPSTLLPAKLNMGNASRVCGNILSTSLNLGECMPKALLGVKRERKVPPSGDSHTSYMA